MEEIELKMMQQKLNIVESRMENCRTGGMKQACIEKTIDLIDDHLKTHAETTSLRIENIIYGLKAELKEIIASAIVKLKSENKDNFKWGIEIIRTFIYIVTFIVGMVAVKKMGM